MIYLPDTNAFSAHLASKSPALSARLKAAQLAGDLRLSIMVLAELEFGAEKARVALGQTLYTRRVRDLSSVLTPVPLGASFTGHYARVRLHLEGRGEKIGDRDTIIAAHALALGATLVTRNVAEFARVPGLKVENWQTD